MNDIEILLAQILSAVYGEEVRGSIHDAIKQCYDDVHVAIDRITSIADKIGWNIEFHDDGAGNVSMVGAAMSDDGQGNVTMYQLE